jgi:hypothetical protein
LFFEAKWQLGRIPCACRTKWRSSPAAALACDESRYTTGSVLGADGGQAVGYFLTVPGRRFSGGRID